ncbi:MAG TPA: ribose 5-phosphate isomerase B [Stellaceae bacterium]|nr:ribose 5-phosphate isomerase B [Stellaceae bacterium]
MAETIAIASDHAGYEMKTVLVSELHALGFHVLDLGTNGGAPVDYPDFAGMLATALADGRADRGVLVCGSGIGISIAANRYRHVRAALCHDTTYARLARQHNNANVLAVGGTRHFGTETAKDILRVFFSTKFEGGRHAPRVEKLSHV